jgi:dolichol-phosphate mannosyltransferase
MKYLSTPDIEDATRSPWRIRTEGSCQRKAWRLKMRVLLALPAYNEAAALPKLFSAFRRDMCSAGFASAVIVVEDGSTDETRRVLDEWSPVLGIDIVSHGRNRGLGEAIRTALRRSLEIAAADDVIVTMDADNTHSTALVAEMVRRIQAGDDIVIASRYRRGAAVVGLMPFRHLTSYGARMLFTLVLPIRGVRDYTSGFRAYRPAVLQRAFAAYGDGLVTEPGFSCMAEILVRLSRQKLKISEVPMVLRYDQKGGASKMNVGKTILTTLKLMVRMRASRK